MTHLTRQQLAEIDRRASQEFGLPTLVLMENAGRGSADLLCRLGIHGPVAICCGRGNNAGDGFVIARHLDLRGHDVRVLLCGDPAKLRDDAAVNFAIVQKAGLLVRVYGDDFDEVELHCDLAGVDWIVDALLGTGAQGAPRPPLSRVIEIANQLPARRFAIDLPSGLDCDTGQCAAPTFHADVTATFVAGKTGFLSPGASAVLGDVHVLDIGAPRVLVDQYLQAR